MNRQVEVTWITLRRISHYLILHARFLEVYIHFALIYTTDNLFPVLPIKDVINKDGDLTTLFKSEKGIKPQYHIYACYFVRVL